MSGEFMVAQREESDLIRAFVKQLTTKYDRKYWVERSEAGASVDEMWAELARGGFLGMMAPEEYGGTGLNMTNLVTLLEELSANGTPLFYLVISALSAIPITRYGTEEQRRRYLPPLLDGREKICFAMTEPDAGTNTFRIQTSARRDGDDYVLNGRKVFISGADEAAHMMVVARTTPADQVKDKRKGLTLFIVESTTPGIALNRMDTRILMPERQYEVFLDDVRVPAGNIIGLEGEGLRPLMDGLNPERINVSAICIGLGRYALAKAVEYACTRQVFDGPIGAYQSIAHPLAAAKTDLELAALMMYKAAEMFDAGEDPSTIGMYSNMAKLAASEAGISAVDAAIQVHGGAGFTGEIDLITIWPLVRLMRTAPVSREMILNYVAEHVLGLPRSY
jgi:acyl-CoA dehydrogenase